ncbi:MAG: tyrosine--tRNA ligase [Thermoproteus sp. AZ2]|jgi:tyrosyl-tRNA synthetase|uniref:Tyrosine--tRNA ligase n=1 Tax=Thermoproteus sp. AZ2 TaxID=1609232 RepID=A0ACC6V0T0_9CREN
MDVEERLRLITRYPTEEVLTVEELKSMLETGYQLSHYIGFEISGYIHIGTGLVSMSKVVDLQRAGVKPTIFLADIHSWLNNKLGGDLDVIRRVAVTYYRETFKSIISALGGDPDGVRFVLGSDLYHNNDEYWFLLMDVVRHLTLSEVRHSLTILGRKMGESVPLAYLVYPPLQVADVFALGAHIPHGGIDQRRAHILAREVATKIRFYPLTLGGERVKPVALHHKLLPALNLSSRPQSKEEMSEMKMSKSIPQSAIFVHDSPEAIADKISKAYCPPRDAEYNPVLEIIHIAAFRDERREPFVVNRPAKYGGPMEFWTYEELEKAYVEGKIHPADLKAAAAEALAKALEPVRRFFEGPGSKALEEMRGLLITR